MKIIYAKIFYENPNLLRIIVTFGTVFSRTNITTAVEFFVEDITISIKHCNNVIFSIFII